MAGISRSTLILSLTLLLAGVAALLPFNGASRAAPSAQPEQTPTATPTQAIDIGNATPIACGQTIGGTTTGAANNVSVYGCAPWLPQTGPERVFSLSINAATDVDALLSGMSSDLDLFLLTGASPASCIAFGDNAISVPGLGPGTYYLVVDGFNGAAGPFRLDVWCPLAVTPTPTPTVTPTATPRPARFSYYLPLLLHSQDLRR